MNHASENGVPSAEALQGAVSRTVWDHILEGTGAFASAVIVLFIYWTTLVGKQSAWVQLEAVLTLSLVAIFALRPGLSGRSGRRRAFDGALTILLIAGALVTGIYMMKNYQAIAAFREGVPDAWDLTV